MSIRMHDKWYKELTMRLPQMTTGKTFYVDANTGSDANSGRYQFAPKLTIQSAVDAVTSDRGDVVIVGAGRYYENVRITKSKMTLMGAQTGGKQSVSIRPAGVGLLGVTVAEADPVYGYSAVNGQAIRGSAVTINAASVELCGLEFDTSGMKTVASPARKAVSKKAPFPKPATTWVSYNGVYVGDGYRINTSYNYDCNGSYIHDCIFKRGAIGMHYDGASEDHRLEHNLFYRTEGGTTKGCVFVDPGGNRQTSRIVIADNIFLAIEDAAYGILGYDSNETKSVLIARNTFLDRVDCSMTYAVCYAGDGDWMVAGNWFGCTNKWSLASEGWESGNYKGVTANTGQSVELEA